jgi:hypothetical protein
LGQILKVEQDKPRDQSLGVEDYRFENQLRKIGAQTIRRHESHPATARAILDRVQFDAKDQRLGFKGGRHQSYYDKKAQNGLAHRFLLRRF